MRLACPACGATAPRAFVQRIGVPIHQNRLELSQNEALRAPRGDLDLAICTRCGLAFNRAFRADLLAYGPGYVNDQTASPFFSRHVAERIEAMVRDGVRGRAVVEIGCGRGDFLRSLCRRGENRGLGLDPVVSAGFFPEGAGVRIEPRLFGGEPLGQSTDVVVARHVIEHVPEPVSFFELVRAALGANPEARLYIETPAIEWILDNLATWDLFYEHASYFSEGSLCNALALAELRAVSTERVFGGQYLWVAAAPSMTPIALQSPSAAELANFGAFVISEASETQRWKDRLAGWASEGEVVIWGAGAKGATFLHLADPHRRRVRWVIDMNPLKQGRFLPGTAHPVVAPERATLGPARHVIVMNPNYRHEVERTIGELGLRVQVHVAERS